MTTARLKNMLDVASEFAPMAALYAAILYVENSLRHSTQALKEAPQKMYAAMTNVTSDATLLNAAQQNEEQLSGHTAHDLHRAANVTAVVTCAAGWLAGTIEQVKAYREMDQYITEKGNVNRSWRTLASGLAAAGGLAAGGVAINESNKPGQEMTTAALAIVSGVCGHASGIFARLESKAALANKLTLKSVAPAPGFNPDMQAQLLAGQEGGQAQQASAPQMGYRPYQG